MQAVEEMIAALGRPVLARALGMSSEPKATIARWRHDGGVVEVAPSNMIRLAMSLIDRRNATRRGDRGRPAIRARAASVSVFSPAEGASIDVKGEADVVQLFLDPSQFEFSLDASFACPPMFDLRDDDMRAMLLRILVHSRTRGPDDALMQDEDLHALVCRIAGHADRPPIEPTAQLFRGGLAPAAFRRVEELIETALNEAGSPGLAAMADAAGLSVTHFVRAFRRQTGSTPHQYLVRRRMERAVSLLRTARMPVADIADKAGFATPAHFVATFRQAMGVTPAALREALAE